MHDGTTREGRWLEDFATLYAHLWYRDFPLQPPLHDRVQVSDWTAHVGIAVRTAAGLLGLFACFESVGRTDAVLRDARGAVAVLEWEWKGLQRGERVVTEFEKLQGLCAREDLQGVRFAGLIGYARETAGKDRHDHTRRSA